MSRRLWLSALLVLWAITGCRTGRNYPAAEGPRYAGSPHSLDDPEPRELDTLRVVSFNLKLAQEIDRAMTLLQTDSALSKADLILLQEMDETGTRRIAERLGMWYVYYPAFYYLKTRRHFGNAILSRWPIVEDRKLVLPHIARFGKTQRIATTATVRAGSSEIRVYSTHLGTMADVPPAARRDQLEAILDDAEQFERVVLGGDMNDEGVGRLARDRGYHWPTERGPPTHRLGRLDHLFFKGFTVPKHKAVGVVPDVNGASDHLPVWALALLR